MFLGYAGPNHLSGSRIRLDDFDQAQDRILGTCPRRLHPESASPQYTMSESTSVHTYTPATRLTGQWKWSICIGYSETSKGWYSRTYTRRWTPRDQGIYELWEVNFWCKFQFGSGQSRWVWVYKINCPKCGKNQLGAKILTAAVNCTDISIVDWILLHAMRWTAAFTFLGYRTFLQHLQLNVFWFSYDVGLAARGIPIQTWGNESPPFAVYSTLHTYQPRVFPNWTTRPNGLRVYKVLKKRW